MWLREDKYFLRHFSLKHYLPVNCIYHLSLLYNFLHMDFLEILNLKSENKGVSTGANWLSSKGEMLHSYSPVDGKLIGSVSLPIKRVMKKQLKRHSRHSFIGE